MKTSNVQSTISGPPSRFGRFAETLKIFSDPVGYMDTQFATFGQIFGVLTGTLTTPPASDYPGTVFIYGPDLIR